MSEELNPVLRLIDQFQARVDPEESFRMIFQLYHSRVEAYFRRKGFTLEESGDLAQETFLQVYKSLDTFRRDSRFERWLFKLMNHVYFNEIRRRKTGKRDALEISIDIFDDGERPSSKAIAESKDPVSELISRERSGALRTALRELPEQMRLCCVLRYERGLKYQEIATLMRISIETVKAHLHQAKKRLTVNLGDTGLP